MHMIVARRRGVLKMHESDRSAVESARSIAASAVRDYRSWSFGEM